MAIVPRNRQPVVFVQFKKLKHVVSAIAGLNNVVPITAKESLKTYKVNQKSYTRWQIPLLPATATTTHKSQSMTAHNGIIYAPGSSSARVFARGLAYVALSRCTKMENLHLVMPLLMRHFDSHKYQLFEITNEYERLKQKFHIA